jgi:hypothetical protein
MKKADDAFGVLFLVITKGNIVTIAAATSNKIKAKNKNIVGAKIRDKKLTLQLG